MILTPILPLLTSKGTGLVLEGVASWSASLVTVVEPFGSAQCCSIIFAVLFTRERERVQRLVDVYLRSFVPSQIKHGVVYIF